MEKELINIFTKKKLTNIILVLYFLSLFLDLHLFYNNYSTLVRIIAISLLFLSLFFKYSTKKDLKLILSYFLIYVVYGFFHLLNINMYYSSEILYLIKMLMGLFIIFTVYKLSIDMKAFRKTMNYCLLFMCGSIIVCNVFKIGYSSYNFEGIKYSIFDWFSGNYNYILSSNKAFFHASNQIIAIIILYIPLLINNLKERINIKNVGILIMSLVSLLMLGNRVSSYGPLIIMMVSVLVYFILLVLRKEKINYYFLTVIFLLMGMLVCLLNVSPINERNKYYHDLVSGNVVNNGIKKNTQKKNVSDKNVDIEKAFNKKLININFPKYYYPYDNDPEFWDEMLKKDKIVLVNSRYIEKEIVKRIIDLNNNQEKDKLLGIGYARIVNVQNIEQDYVMQYYSLGIIGLIIIIGLYFVIYLYLLLKVLLKYDVKFNYRNIMLLLSIGNVLVIAYYSGNLLNSLSFIIPLNFVIGISMVEVNKKENDYPNMILGFNVYNAGKKELLEQLKQSDKQSIIFNINPLIVSNYYDNEKYVKEFNKQKYNIPDGYGIIFASKMKDGNITRQVPGIELMDDICRLSQDEKYRVYLYGAKKEKVKKAKKALEEKYPNINKVGNMDGYVKTKEALNDITKNKPDVLFVALGSPKQEEFIIENKKLLRNIRIIMPVGGSFDVLSGSVKRAPKIFIRMHLEWLYRMIKEPKRIKQNMGIIKFLLLVIFENNWYNKKRRGAVK